MSLTLEQLDRNDREIEAEFLAAKAANAKARQRAESLIEQKVQLSKTALEKQRKEAAYEAAQAAYAAYTDQLKTDLAALATVIADERDELQHALDLATMAREWQYRQADRFGALIKQFATGAQPYRLLAESEQEFTRLLLETSLAATAGLEATWFLKLDPNLARALRWGVAGWLQHMAGDVRARAISDGLKLSKQALDQPADQTAHVEHQESAE